MIDAWQVNEEVLFTRLDVTAIGRDDIQLLVAKAGKNRRKRIRLCAHKDADVPVHEMLIVHTSGVYVRPHKHVSKSESFHLIDGRVTVVMFADDGSIKETIPMSEYRAGGTFYYRIAAGVFHTLLIRSEYVVFHETTAGPFNRAEMVYAPWAPDEDDAAGVQRFLQELHQRVGAS